MCWEGSIGSSSADCTCVCIGNIRTDSSRELYHFSSTRLPFALYLRVCVSR